MILADTAAENDAIRTALVTAKVGGADWDAPEAATARVLTEEAGWSWDFTTWADALGDFDGLLAQASNQPRSARAT
jgi:hypothetical protein